MQALLKSIDNQLYKSLRVDTDLLKFMVRQRVVGFDVPSAPFFDTEETTAWFLETLRRSRRYLEYGSGGSTYVAAKLGVEFITVESDPYFLKSVRRKIRADGFERPTGQTYHYADVGVTGYVGQPLFHWRASDKRIEQFRRYSDPPPAALADGRLPDLVLVDGRFRVACALKALRMLRDVSGWKIVVDDYSNRPDYRVIADFAAIGQSVGSRMVVFTSPRDVDNGALDAAIDHYETVPD